MRSPRSSGTRLGDKSLAGIFLRACESAVDAATQRGDIGSIALDLMRYLRDAEDKPKRIPVEGATGEAVTDSDGNVWALPTDFATEDPDSFKDYGAAITPYDKQYALLAAMTDQIVRDPSIPLELKAVFVHDAWASYMRETLAVMEEYLQSTQDSVKTFDPADPAYPPIQKPPEGGAPLDWRNADPATLEGKALHDAVKAAVEEMERTGVDAWPGSDAEDEWTYTLADAARQLATTGYEKHPADPDYDIAEWTTKMRKLLADIQRL
ncbi:MAG: hypothetical protein QM820_46530 [Minicystis sp.]